MMLVVVIVGPLVGFALGYLLGRETQRMDAMAQRSRRSAYRGGRP